MGYTTDFEGVLTLDKPLTEAQAEYLRKFNNTRRIKRDEGITQGLEDEVRMAAGLPVGDEGGFYVGSTAPYGQDRYDAPGVLDSNQPPIGQPGLWCQWTIGEKNDTIEWDQGEKFYSYHEWLFYLIEHFLKPWGYVVNGSIDWEGEDSSDVGTIVVVDNVIAGMDYDEETD